MPRRLPEPARPLVMSYLGVRRAVGVIGAALPPALVGAGWAAGVPVQDDMSSYYHTPLRDLFVGATCAVGVFLFCYRGHDRAENWTANVGCLAALGLAFCPIDANSAPPHQRTATGLAHTLCGGAFFLTLAAYSLVHFPRGADEEDANDRAAAIGSGRAHGAGADPHAPQRALIYRVSGAVILLSTLGMGAYLFLLPAAARAACDDWNALLFGEWVAVWAFAAAWLTKGRAIGADLAVALLAEVECRLPSPVRPHRRPRDPPAPAGTGDGGNRGR